ncbi:MAG: PTS sugar transporter subunit IIA [Hellea sp.]|nr:PTS sugar transporter subunit IIA [Hellea sp.]
MFMNDLLSRDCVAIDLKISSKKQLIQEMAQLMIDCGCLAGTKIEARDIITAAMERERLGSTGVGSGVALPHARIEGLDKVTIAFARLDAPIDFEAIDERPVDLVALILAPAASGSDHLRALAQISRRLRKDDIRAKLRNAPTAESIYIILAEEAQATAA